jgi:hypothetical protein
MRKDEVVCFKVLFQQLYSIHSATVENHVKPVGITGVLAEIQTRDFPSEK